MGKLGDLKVELLRTSFPFYRFGSRWLSAITTSKEIFDCEKCWLTWGDNSGTWRFCNVSRIAIQVQSHSLGKCWTIYIEVTKNFSPLPRISNIVRSLSVCEYLMNWGPNFPLTLCLLYFEELWRLSGFPYMWTKCLLIWGIPIHLVTQLLILLLKDKFDSIPYIILSISCLFLLFASVFYWFYYIHFIFLMNAFTYIFYSS